MPVSTLRKQLRKKDLEDLNAGRAVLGKLAYQEWVRGIMHSKRSQIVAANIAKGLRKVCKEVVDGGGIATQGQAEGRCAGRANMARVCA